MLALDRRYLDEAGAGAVVIRGFVGLSGPYDFLPLQSRILGNVSGSAPDLATTQPINYVSASSPSTLLIHGGYDSAVRVENPKSLATVLRARDVTRN